jgi:asparagine synthase (glutamine-hydrolysing)
MCDRLGRYWITFNGEIYNHVELRRELREIGHNFQGKCDTEVLLKAFQEWGELAVGRFRGMYAFAIWDAQEKRLFAARDPLGIKPFHYAVTGTGDLAFASELKALLPLIEERSINQALASAYLAWNLLDHEPTETFIKEIKRLAPGHMLIWEPGRKISLSRFWKFPLSRVPETTSADRERWISGFREQLEETLALHLRSDVPIGTCLSGGLDSSAIVCLANQQLRQSGRWRRAWQNTFSAVFDEPELDERRYIRSVVEATGCKPHFITPAGESLREDLETWLWHQDEPVANTNPYAHFCVARLARANGIKVLLDGQGADEQLAGYRKFIPLYLRQLWKAGQPARAAWEALRFFSSPDLLRTIRWTDGRRYLFGNPAEIARLWPAENRPARPAALGLGGSMAERIAADLTQFSLPLLLRYEDRNTMAFGVEARVPFVDYKLVEWIANVPVDLRLRGGWTKWILRQALADVLPVEVQRRKSKLGFSTPESAWLSGSLSSWLRETLNEQRWLGEIVERRAVRQTLIQFERGERTKPLLKLLFRLAIYETWARRFLGTAARRAAVSEPELICN